MTGREIAGIIACLGEEFSSSDTAYFGHLVRCGQKIPAKLGFDPMHYAKNAFYGVLLVSADFLPEIGQEITDANHVSWLVDHIVPLYDRAAVQGYYLLLRTNQGIGNV